MILYRLLYFPLRFLIVLLNPILGSKLKTMVNERLKKVEILRRQPQGPCIWIHASSGEVEYAKPLLRELRAQRPDCYLLLTYYSPSAKKLIMPSPEWDALLPLPFDTPFDLAPLFLRFQPQALLYARTDVWPELATQAQNRKIPQILFSATFAANSSRLNSFVGRWFTKLALQKMDQIRCVSRQDAELLTPLNLSTQIIVAGDTRFDQVQWRLQHQQIHLQRKFDLRPTWILGSTWSEDESQILNMLIAYTKEHKISLIWAPHEVSRIASLQTKVQQAGLEFELWSDIHEGTNALWNDQKVLLINQVGYLAALYPHAQIAFVGGSFKHQVHSVMEPLAAGLPVLVGPYFQNNREAVDFMNRFVFEYDPKLDPVQYIETLNFKPQQLRQEIQAHLGASSRLASDLLALIQKKQNS